MAFMARSVPSLRSAARRILPHVPVLAAALVFVALPASAPLPAVPFRAAFDAAPGLAPRVSASATFRACTEQAPEHGTVTRAACPPARRGGTARLARIAAEAARGADAEALHTLALAEMVLPDDRGRALERAVDGLRRASVLSDRTAPLLADLAAALIVRAERKQAPRDLLEAYEAAQQALATEPRNAVARYNAALALERFGLVDETMRAWTAYLEVDGASEWASDARRRIRVLRSLAPPTPPSDDAPLSAYAAYAAADAQGARELGMERLLGEWGAAVEAGESTRAADRLARAAALGEALVRRPGGDAGLDDMVRAIRGIESTDEIRRLARAHREYAAGQAAFRALVFDTAHIHFTATERDAAASPALLDWARAMRGTMEVQIGPRADGMERLLSTARGVAPRHPALAGRVGWSISRTGARAEGFESSVHTATVAARHFAAAGERENQAAAWTVAAECYFTLGEPDSAYATLHQAIAYLRPFRGSVRFANLATANALNLAGDGLAASAGALLAEGIDVADRTGHRVIAAEVRTRMSVHQAAIGRPGGADELAGEARVLFRTLRRPGEIAWIRAGLHEVDATRLLSDDPRRAASSADSAAAAFAGSAMLRALPPMVASARAHLAMGDEAGAVRRLENMMEFLDRRRDSVRMEPRRAAVFDAARAAVDRLALLKLAADRPAEALEVIDRARASLAAAGLPDAGRIALARGEVAIEYARIADTLLAWTVAEGRVAVARTVLDTLRFSRTIDELRDQLERGASDDDVRPALRLLHEWLIRPVSPRLRAGAPLVIVADGEVAAIPFAALFDGARDRYLVQDHAIRFAVSLRAAPSRPSGGTGRMLLVSDPAFSPSEEPLLDRLPNARREVGQLAQIHRGAGVLEGAHATRTALLAQLRNARVIHVAGHAVFDDQRPERSGLLLAPGPDGHDGRLTAADLAALDLRHVRLVVLSACSTVRGGRSRASGFSGLAGAVLAAGAGGTVGSLWRVEDSATPPLMTAFHRAYATSDNAARALRHAQLSLLASADPRLRSPGVWAAFRYVGS